MASFDPNIFLIWYYNVFLFNYYFLSGTLNCFLDLIQIFLTDLIRNRYFCICFDSLECIFSCFHCLIAFEGNIFQFCIFVECFRINLGNICTDHNLGQSCFLLECFRSNLCYFERISIFGYRCRNGYFLDIFLCSCQTRYLYCTILCIRFRHFVYKSALLIGNLASLGRYFCCIIFTRCRIWGRGRIRCRGRIWRWSCLLNQSIGCLFQSINCRIDFGLCCVSIFQYRFCCCQSLFKAFYAVIGVIRFVYFFCLSNCCGQFCLI